MSEEIVVIEEIVPIVKIEETIPVVQISSPGPQGPPGTFNPGDIAYIHNQAIASSVWTINHNLGFNPVCVILDSAGTNCEGTISYPNINTMVISFSASFTGVAYLV